MKSDRIDTIFEEVGKLSVELDPDPAARGPIYLQDLISKTRGYLNQTSVYIQEVLREQRRVEMDLRAREDSFEVSSNELLTSDPRVKSMPAIEDRKSMIQVLLKEEYHRIVELRREQKDMEHVFKVVKHCQKELNATMSEIRLQRALISDQLKSGSFYGDENDVSRGTVSKPPAKSKKDIGPVEDFDEDEVRKMLDEAEAEQKKKEEATASTVVKSESTESNWDDFLGSMLDPVVLEPEPVPTASTTNEDPAINQFLNDEEGINALLEGV
jgi:hypothetical protein